MTEAMDKIEATKRRAPKWTLGTKPEMIIGAGVPSWTKSIPGPKYDYATDQYKERRPQWSMRYKPKMIMGDSVPSWVKSIPGPKYSYDADTVKTRMPVYSIRGRGESEVDKASKSLTNSVPNLSQDEMKSNFEATHLAPPKFSLVSKPLMIPGEPVPSWVKSIPGPKYSFSTDSFKNRKPVWSMGPKLPTESDLMKVRSPGPIYGGSAMDVKKQELCDGSKHRTPATSFGIGARWEGKAYDLVRTGASARYNRPAMR